MAKFKVGDRVRVISVGCRKIIEVGDAGTIKGCSALGNYAVEFDRQSSYFIRCDGLTKRDRGLWVSPEHLELIEEKPTREFKLIITSSGDTARTNIVRKPPLKLLRRRFSARMRRKKSYSTEK